MRLSLLMSLSAIDYLCAYGPTEPWCFRVDLLDCYSAEFVLRLFELSFDV